MEHQERKYEINSKLFCKYDNFVPMHKMSYYSSPLRVYSHSMRLLELADLLDLVHEVSSIYILHDEIQSVLEDKDEEVREVRIN